MEGVSYYRVPRLNSVGCATKIAGGIYRASKVSLFPNIRRGIDDLNYRNRYVAIYTRISLLSTTFVSTVARWKTRYIKQTIWYTISHLMGAPSSLMAFELLAATRVALSRAENP